MFLDDVVCGHDVSIHLTDTVFNLSQCQCENLEDVKLNLTGSDYGPYLANEASPIYTSTIVEKCTKKLVDDWNKMRCEVRPLSDCHA